MPELEEKLVLMRIFIGEDDRHEGRPLYHALLEALREEKIAGATALRGIAGFGAHSHMHKGSLLRLSQDLPIILEAVDSEENLRRVLPRIDAMVGKGLVTLEGVRVVRRVKSDAS